MSSDTLEKILYWIVRVGAYLLPFTLLIMIGGLFFPFISGKNFAFRIIVELMTAGWLGLLILDFKKYWPKWGPVSVAFTVFVGTIFLSAVFGVDFRHSFWSNFERMEGLVTHLHLLALFFALAGTFRTRREWFALFGVSIAASSLVAFYGLLERTGEVVSFADSSRIISTLGNPLYVAAYLSFNIFLIAFLFFYIRFTALKWFLSAVMLFEIAIFFLTAARGAFVGMLFGAGIILLFSLFTEASNKKKAIIAAAIVFILSVPVFLNVFRDASFIQSNSVLARFSSISLEAGKARFTLWGMALEAFKERPILGWGIENFDVPFAKHYDPRMFHQEPWFDRTHNMPLEWLVAGGAVGFLAYLLLFVSIIPALVRSVRKDILEKRSIPVFIGMFAAYLIQLLFVFDTLSTYLMLVMTLGFLHVASFSDLGLWSRINSLAPAAGPAPENPMPAEKLSRKELREIQRRMSKTRDQDDSAFSTLSAFRASATLGVFLAATVLVVTINIRPMLANRALIESLALFGERRLDEAVTSAKRALELAAGTIGVQETREHLVFNTYNLFSDEELLRKPEGQAVYRLAAEEMEKQIVENGEQYPKLKHYILLVQLYHQWALFATERDAFDRSIKYYDRAVQLAPNYVSVYPIAANFYAQAGNISEAIRLIEAAVSLLEQADKYDQKIFYSRALFYAAARRYDDAYSALAAIKDKYAEGGRLDAEMMKNVVLSTRSQGTSSIPFLEKIYGLDQSILATPSMLAQLYAIDGDSERARFYANEALKIDSSIKETVDQFLGALKK